MNRGTLAVSCVGRALASARIIEQPAVPGLARSSLLVSMSHWKRRMNPRSGSRYSWRPECPPAGRLVNFSTRRINCARYSPHRASPPPKHNSAAIPTSEVVATPDCNHQSPINDQSAIINQQSHDADVILKSTDFVSPSFTENDVAFDRTLSRNSGSFHSFVSR